MLTPIEAHAPLRLDQANLTPRGPVFPSPEDWRDQILYFLLPDRFSDGNEHAHPLFDPSHPAQFAITNKAAWMAAGKGFTGGTLNGIRSKLPYLKGLGMTTLWVGPVFKQCASLETYHGYGIQNFLDVDPRFGTRQDLRDLVDEAHALGMYVLLDIIYNHTGNVFFYDNGGTPASTLDYRFEPPYPLHGWRSGGGASIQTPLSVDDAIQPQDFQDVKWFTRAGKIHRWDPADWEKPLHPLNEFRRGDFYDLKNLELEGATLSAIIDVYRYWIALSDCDGFRIDTVKHVPFEASRHFCGGIREFTESIGKNNFLLLGEVTGGAAMARDYLDVFGRNLDATLDLGDPAERLASVAKGFRPAQEFFEIFDGHDALGSHREAGRYHVSVLDDHDKVGLEKRRFAAANSSPGRFEQSAHVIGLQTLTLGIPCIYYGTEQALDGSFADHDVSIEPLSDGKIPFDDRYIRECMFAGPFGAFRTSGCHVFNPNHPTYVRVAALARVRGRKDAVGLALRRGRSYLRCISTDSVGFHKPAAGQVVAWSRILYRTEVLVCFNTSSSASASTDVTIDATLHAGKTHLNVLYRGDWSDHDLANPPVSETVPIQVLNGRSTVRVQLPAAGMMVLSAS